MIWKILVGSKTARIVAGALVAISILFGMILWWENTIRNQVLQGVENKDLKQEIETRDKIDESLRNSPAAVNDAINWLLERQRR